MSVFIPGVELPKGDNVLMVYPDGSINLRTTIGRQRIYEGLKGHAYEVQTPHGELVDADRYAKLLRKWRDDQERKRIKMLQEGMHEEADRAETMALAYNSSLMILGKIQTIIEAEGPDMREQKCKYLSEDFSEVCTNGDCPVCADFCPVTQHPEICKFAEMEEAE